MKIIAKLESVPHKNVAEDISVLGVPRPLIFSMSVWQHHFQLYVEHRVFGFSH
jgi:hypothetical protein